MKSPISLSSPRSATTAGLLVSSLRIAILGPQAWPFRFTDGKVTIAREYDTPDWSRTQAQTAMEQALPRSTTTSKACTPPMTAPLEVP